MPRPLDLARRAQIAEQAFRAIQHHGVHRVTMSSLAKALGMKRTALYHYFPNLGAICLSVGIRTA